MAFLVGLLCFQSNVFSFQAHGPGVWRLRPVFHDRKVANLLAANGIYHFKDYVLWLNQNFSYKKETLSGEWQLPEKVIANRFGDCKGYSVLNYAVLKLFGYRPVVLAMRTGNSGHVVCAFPLNKHVAFFDNNQLIVSPARSFHEFEAFLFHYYHFKSLFVLNGHNLSPAGRLVFAGFRT